MIGLNYLNHPTSENLKQDVIKSAMTEPRVVSKRSLMFLKSQKMKLAFCSKVSHLIFLSASANAR
jgi:hypothetical protein